MALGTQKKLLVIALAAVMLVGCGGKEERKAKYLERGKAFIAEDNWEKARVEIRNVLQIDPKDAEAYYLMGRLEEKKQEWYKAFGNYSKAIELNPDLVDARSRLAQFYMLQANAYKAQDDRDSEANALGMAQAELDEIFKRDLNNSDAQTVRAAMLLREGKAAESLALVESIIKQNPSHGSAAGLLASLYEQAGRNADAEKVLVTAAGKADEPIPLKFQLAQLYAREKKNDAAEKAMREIIAMRPDELNYRVQLAQFLAQTDQIDKAEVVMRDAVSADPGDSKRYLTLSALLVAKKGASAAVEYLQQSIDQKPELSDLRLGLASLFEQEKKPDDAIKIYEGMVSRYGDEPAGLKARNHLAAHASAAGDMSAARKLIDEVLTKNPKDNDALLMLGRMALQQSDYDTAVGAFRSVLKDQPDSVPVLHLLAEAQLRKGDTELAGDNLRRAVEVAPQNADAHIKYARYLIAKKELARALEQIDAVLNKDPSNADAIAAKSEVLAAKGDLAAVKVELAKLKEATPGNPEASLRLARVYMAEADNGAAMSEIDGVLRNDENNLAALILKSDMLAMSSDTAGLEAAINRIKTVAPDNPEGFFRMGRFLRAKSDIDGALKEYELAYARAKGDGEAVMLNEIIGAQVATGQADSALARVEALMRDNPEHKVANQMLGRVQIARKDYTAAEAAFARQIQINPNSATVYAELSAARELQGNKAGAVAAFEQGFGILKDDLSLQMGLAAVYERQENVDAAMDLYEKVLAKQPDNAIAVNNLASLLSDNRTDDKNLNRAKELAAKLETAQQPALRDTLGWVYYRTGDYPKAVEVLEGVVNAEPKVAIFQYHLGMAYAKAGDKTKAKNALSQALELGDFPGADEARKVLGTL